MDVGKLKGLTIGDLVARAQALGEKLEPDNPDFADNLALSLVKSVVHGTEDLGPIIDLFGSDDDISGGLFPDDAVSVTETSVSLPKDTEINREGIAGDMTPEEEQMLDQAINPEEDDVFAQILNANTDEELQAALGITDDNKPAEDSSTDEPPADFSDTDKTSAEEAADKSEEPKEEKPAESKPEEKKEEPKEEKPTEFKPEEKKEEEPKEEKPKETSKDESDDTMKNITSALSDRF